MLHNKNILFVKFYLLKRVFDELFILNVKDNMYDGKVLEKSYDKLKDLIVFNTYLTKEDVNSKE